MIELEQLVKISQYAGERLDLTQAAGGNSSVKLDNGEMYIKASGFILSDINLLNGYAKVNTKQVIEIIFNSQITNNKNKKQREQIAAQLVKEATITNSLKPSIETLLHALLLKYTLHTHPIVVNMICIQKEWKQILKKSLLKKILFALIIIRLVLI